MGVASTRTISPDVLEAEIANATREMAAAADRETRWNWWKLLKALHSSRTPTTVERLERERGLA